MYYKIINKIKDNEKLRTKFKLIAKKIESFENIETLIKYNEKI